MRNEDNNVNKDTANSLTKYSYYVNKGTNVVLDSANEISKWYIEQLNKLTENSVDSNRLETNVDNSVDIIENTESALEINTKVNKYEKLQTVNKPKNINNISNINYSKLNTKSININLVEDNIEDTKKIDITENNEDFETIVETASNEKSSISTKITNTIKGTKFINNITNKMIQTGKTINTGLNENGLKSFENTSSRIATKPVKKVTNKVGKKATNVLVKQSTKYATKVSAKVVKKTTELMLKLIKLIAQLIANVMKAIISMLPEIAPVIIIIVIIVAFFSYFGLGMSEDTRTEYEEYMVSVQDEYDSITTNYYNQGKIVEGTINGKGFINWKAPLSIIQMLNGDLTFDYAEIELLNAFNEAGLFEKITEESYSYEETIEEKDKDGVVTTKKETKTDTKKVVSNPSLNDYIEWCDNNFFIITNYKINKNLPYDEYQNSFTYNEVEQIKMLYNSTSFFELFSNNFQNTYAYLNVSIRDEQLQAIYNEFITNAGKRYLMDHSNLSYDTCMNYYDCSSWVIHCLAHTGIIKIPNTNAQGIYNNHCTPISVEDRQAGDLIFLKDTYDTGRLGGISHIGIYMGELTINGETSEWIIDTGGNPSGVKISKYQNGWWNGSNFYGFGRLKQ